MPRSTSRPTLKLPAKPTKAASKGEFSETRSPARKPVRGGLKGAKPSAAQNAQRLAAMAAPKPSREAPPVRMEVRASANTTNKPVPPRPAQTAPLAPKVYPKRGIARSTGARALPPVRTDSQRSAPTTSLESPRFTPPAPPSSPAPVREPRLERHAEQVAPSPSEAITPRRPLKEPPRLSKRVSEMAQCSRREADEWIENGWVRVDGVVVTTLGTRAHPGAKIEIKEEASKHQTESVTILLNKPLDADSEPAAYLSLITPDNRWEEDDTPLTFKATHLRGLALAGRLDAESTGMLVFTQEGSVARRITGDETRLEKEYMVRVEGELAPEDMQRLNFGLALDDIKLKRAQVSWQNEQQLRFVLHESRPNQIPRMCELVGLRVTSIKRIRIGSVSLGKLPPGKWRYLRANERF